jgi:hypothetical protein
MEALEITSTKADEPTLQRLVSHRYTPTNYDLDPLFDNELAIP